MIAMHTTHWQKIAEIHRVTGAWKDNESLDDWSTHESTLDNHLVIALKAYVREAKSLPIWADIEKIALAQKIFMENGILSATLLLCASLPECYVVPDLASVLRATGQMESHTVNRIRATGMMVLPVMTPGGLTDAKGNGVAQVLRVRLIHALVRNPLLRGSPQDALAVMNGELEADAHRDKSGIVKPHASVAKCARSMHQALFAHGWNLAEQGVPCNQEELAYTLLTFNYVFLRSMHKLNISLCRADEEAYLHAWNVMGYVLGIEEQLMAHTLEEAEKLFLGIQERARRKIVVKDVRPYLGAALMKVMEGVIPYTALKIFPALMTSYLCGEQTSRDLGVNVRISSISSALFEVSMSITRCFDRVIRKAIPSFSLSRTIAHALGEKLVNELWTQQMQTPDMRDLVLARERR
jgi:ER-bound oxygenase mpaB/B'/Rubber oxygenase, catalytic domain